MIRTFFPSEPTRERLERLALRHALELASERDQYGGGIPVERLVVNFLRHACTDYDLEQSAERHRAACEAIARRFPWLSEECQHQIARRARAEVEARVALEQQRWEREQERDRRRSVVDASRRAVAGLRVGQRVRFPYKTLWYTGTITKVGRSRVTVDYEITTGRNRARTRLVHAALVIPVVE